MTRLSRESRKCFQDNEKAFKHAFEETLVYYHGFDENTAEELTRITNDMATVPSTFSLINSKFKVSLQLDKNKDISKFIKFLDDFSDSEVLSFGEINIPVVVCEKSKRVIDFYPPSVNSKIDKKLIEKMLDTLVLKSFDTTCIRFVTRYSLGLKSFHYQNCSRVPLEHQRFSTPIVNGFVSDFKNYQEEVKLEITSIRELDIHVKKIKGIITELILPEELIRELLDIDIKDDIHNKLRRIVKFCTVKVRNPENRHGESTEKYKRETLRENSLYQYIFGDLIQVRLEEVFSPSISNSCIPSWYEKEDLYKNSSHPLCIIDEGNLANSFDEKNLIEVYYYDSSSNSLQAFQADRVEIYGYIMRAYEPDGYIQVPKSCCKFLRTSGRNEPSHEGFSKFCNNLLSKPLCKVGCSEDILYRDRLDIIEELEETAFIKCDFISLVSECETMWTLKDQVYCIGETSIKESSIYKKVQRFEFTEKDFSLFKNRQELVDELKDFTFKQGVKLIGGCMRKSFNPLLSCLKLKITDLSLKIDNSDLKKFDEHTRNRLRKLLYSLNLDSFKLTGSCLISIPEGLQICPKISRTEFDEIVDLIA
ncbi:unnamed protein product [Moneuplotes crassus]|uniref:Uncharacterized protein n=1 Tax=Euplotes crassus TaxID=5936 RepID=A0AAD1X8Z7_EUPCR|nr:unnamed protein product [Moneuplotes crassus]